MRLPLDESRYAVIGSDGTATVAFGPERIDHTWRVRWATVESDSQRATVAYLSTIGGLQGATRSGNQDTTDLPDLWLRAGVQIEALWRGGAPGARVRLSLYGEIEIGGHSGGIQ